MNSNSHTFLLQVPSEVEEALTGGGSARFSGAPAGTHHGLSSPLQRRLIEQPAPVSPLVERCAL